MSAPSPLPGRGPGSEPGTATPPHPRRGSGRGGWWSRWWVAVCGLALVVASDYDVRTRPPSEATGGAVDAAILAEIAVYGAVGAYLVLVHARPPHAARMRPQLYLLAFYVGLIVLSVTYTPFVLYGAVRAVQMCVLLGLVLAASRDVGRAHLHRFAHGFVALVAVSVVYGVLVPSEPVNRLQEGRFTWFAIHPTVSGVLAGIATVVVVAYLSAGRRERPGPRWPVAVYVLALSLVGGALVAAQTRGAVLGAVVAVVVVLVSMRSGRALVELVLTLLVLGAGALAAGGQIVAAYLARGEDPSQLATLNSRTELWRVAWSAVRADPLYGYGTTAARGIFYEETGLGGGHNAVVNVAVELGGLGLLVWGALFVVLALGLRRLPQEPAGGVSVERGLLLGVVAFLVVDGVVYEGAGAVTNVAATWLFVCVAWLTVAQRHVTGTEELVRAARATSGGGGV